MGTTERVKLYLENKGISKYLFYKKTGFSNKFLDNSSNMGTDRAEIILRHYPDINPVWLLTGNGDMLKSAAPQREPVKEPENNNDILVLYRELLQENKALQREMGAKDAEIAQLTKRLNDVELHHKSSNRADKPPIIVHDKTVPTLPTAHYPLIDAKTKYTHPDK